MIKKILKWVFIIVIVLGILYFIHSFITAKVYFDIYAEMKNKVNSEDDFYAKVQMPIHESYQVTQEVFIKDNVYVKILQRRNKETNDLVTLKFWQNYSQNEPKGYIFIESSVDNTKYVQVLNYNDVVDPENKMYRYELARSLVLGSSLQDFSEYSMPEYSYSKILLSVIKHPTILYSTEFNGEECYAIKFLIDSGGFLFSEFDKPIPDFLMCFYTNAEYVSKETKLPVGTYASITSEVTSYSYFTKEVTEDDIRMPNLEEYEVQESN